MNLNTVEPANNGHPRDWSKTAVMYMLIIIREVIWGLIKGGRYVQVVAI